MSASVAANIDKVSAQIDANKDSLIARLAEAVEIPSVSGSAKYRPQTVEMGKWCAKALEKIGCENIEFKELGNQTLDGQEIGLPPVVFADYKSGADSKNKKTILVYGHYDVQPANKSDGWNTEPFKLIHDEKTGRLYGRGSTDDKGPIIGWINTIEAHQQAGVELPVNLKFCFEGMEESGSVGLDQLIEKEAEEEVSTREGLAA
jgi:Cys-Gly metallodipeptidase DUG1